MEAARRQHDTAVLRKIGQEAPPEAKPERQSFDRAQWMKTVAGSGLLKGLGNNALSVLWYLVAEANHHTGRCYRLIETIASGTQLRESSVRRALKLLIEKGLIERRPRNNRSSEFRIVMDPDTEPTLFDVAEPEQAGDNLSASVDFGADGGRAQEHEGARRRAPGGAHTNAGGRACAPHYSPSISIPNSHSVSGDAAGVADGGSRPAGGDGSRRNRAKGRVPHVGTDDLRQTERLMARFGEAVQRGAMTDCEADRLNWAGAAERALEVGKNPPAVFAAIVRDQRFQVISGEQEQRAHRRLKRWRDGPERPRESEQGPSAGNASAAPRQGVSGDARAAGVILARARTRPRIRNLPRDQLAAEIWPEIRQRKPDWTWERWQRAVDEWRQATERGDVQAD